MTTVQLNASSEAWEPPRSSLSQNGRAFPRPKCSSPFAPSWSRLNGTSHPAAATSPSSCAAPRPNGTLTGTSNHVFTSAWATTIMPTPPDSPPPNLTNKGLLTPTTSKFGLKNLLKVPTSNANNYFLTRRCSYIFYCARIEVPCKYPKLTNQLVIENERVQEALERMVSEELQDSDIEDSGSSGSLYMSLISRYKKDALATLNNLKAALSSTLIRLTGYVLFKVFNFLFMSVTVTEGQLQMIETASKRNLPLIFVPLHRSHVDYLFVTWILFNREIPAPIVAAGDNLRMPIFGWLLRGLGGFFIKRKLEATKTRKDYVYRAILQTYMSQALHRGYNLEFFIEGGRTRTGKPCLPRGGLLSVIVDAFLSGTLDDALIVPIAINYDKILDGNFIREQLGQKKVPESFWRAVLAIAKVLSTSYGHSRIDFSQPFSLKEFFQSRKTSLSGKAGHDSLTPPCEHPMSNGHQRSLSTPFNPSQTVTNGHLHATRSNSSLFGSEVTEEYRHFVKSLASHIVYDAEKCQAIMATNAVAYLLSFLHREGTSLHRLSLSVASLQEDLRFRGRDTGFSGDSTQATIHAVTMLGSSLVHVDGDLVKDEASRVFIRPITVFPNVIELNYYANALSPLFAVDAIVATSLITMADCDLWSYQDISTDCVISRSKLIQRSKRLCEILQNEFLFVPSCGSLDVRISEAIYGLVLSGLLLDETSKERSGASRTYYNSELEDDDDEYESGSSPDDTFYRLLPTNNNLEKVSMVTRGLTPLIDSYHATLSHVTSLIGRPSIDSEFAHDVQRTITAKLQKGVFLYGESIAVDPIRNAIKLLESDGVLECYYQNTLKVLFLNKDFESEERLWPLQQEIGSFRV